MTKLLSAGPYGTLVPNVPGYVVGLSALDLANFQVVESSPGVVKYTNIAAPMDRPSTLKRAHRVRKNVYAGTSIDPMAFLPNKQGSDIMVEVQEVWSITDESDASFRQDFPVRCAISITVPNNELVTGQEVKDLLGRTLAGLGGQPIDDRLPIEAVSGLLRGVAAR